MRNSKGQNEGAAQVCHRWVSKLRARCKLQHLVEASGGFSRMRFDTLIRNGTIVTATDTYLGDVGILDGKIAAIGKDLPVENAKNVIEARGRYVMPGGIDVHT